MRPPRMGWPLICFWEVGDRVVGPGWAELAGRARSGSGREEFDNLVVSASL